MPTPCFPGAPAPIAHLLLAGHSPADNSALLPINNTGADLLVAYTDNSSSVAMAFTSPSTKLSQAILSSGSMTVIDFLDADFGDVQVSAPALQPLTQLFNGQGRNETLEQVGC